jgi:hypothetical protein
VIYVTLGSQPVVSSVLKDCSLNTNTMLFDNVGDLSYETLLWCLNNQFKDFFPAKDKIKIQNGAINLLNGNVYTIIKDERNGTLFYDVLPLGKKLSTIYNGAKTKYERLALDFTKTIQNTSSAIFIRQMMDDNDNDTIELSDTLKWVYPACKFYLKHRYAGIQPNKCYDYWKRELCGGK